MEWRMGYRLRIGCFWGDSRERHDLNDMLTVVISRRVVNLVSLVVTADGSIDIEVDVGIFFVSFLLDV
jgi:hypothetical protein